MATELGTARESDADRRPPEQSASATSGTYFRAPRGKLQGLRLGLDGGVWRADSERIARCVIADAECGPGTDWDEE